MHKSKVVGGVVADLVNRERVGVCKYGVTMDREDLTEAQWMQHQYEELLDAALYLKAQLIIKDLTQLSPAKLLKLKNECFSRIKQIDEEFRRRE